MHFLIRRLGTLIDVSTDGLNPLPGEIVDLLRPLLVYEHKKLLRGHNAYNPNTGERLHIDVTIKRMYRIEEGRVVTGYGFISKIARVLQAQGHQVHYIDISPARQRPDCYAPNWDNLLQHFAPRPRQLDCLRAIDGAIGGLVDATMGFGKTKLFEALAWLYPTATMAIVVKPKDVAARIVRQLTRSFPNIGQIGGGKSFMGDRITVFTAGSCHHAAKFNTEFDFLLVDEAHQLMSDKYAEAISTTFMTTRNFAFTATPDGRMDGADAQLEMFFGPTIFQLPYPEAVALGLVVPIHVRWVKFTGTHNPAEGKSDVSKVRWGIWRNEERNARIAQDVHENYQDPETQVLISVATIDHAVRLWRHLPEFSLCYSGMSDEECDSLKRSKLVPPGFQPVTPEVRENMRSAFEQGTLKRVIATDVWSTGVDFEHLPVVWRADARESEILDAQWPGRASRISSTGNKTHGEIVDMVDMWDKTFRNKSYARKRHYAKHGWSQDWPTGLRQIGHV